MAHQHHFIPCPDGCGAQIPSRLICRGKNVPWHAGLEYQVCPCGYFTWLDPELYNAAERRHVNSPANGAPPFPPPEYPDDPWAASPQLPSFAPNIHPSLQQPAYSFASQPPPATTQPIPSTQIQPIPSTQPTKAKCKSGPCTRIAGSRRCTYRMCKTCCEQQRKGCEYPGHRTNTASAPTPSSTPDDPSALSRPAPMFSYDTSPPPSSSESPLAPKLYSKPMDPAWAQRYNKNHEAQEVRKREEEERREQELLVKHQIRICFWGTDGVDPEMFRQQGVRPWPKFNLSKYPPLLKKLNLAVDDEVQVYDFDSGCWDREDVDHIMEVSSSQVILMRRLGVVQCPRIDESIERHSPHHTTTRRSLPAAAGKRKRHTSSTPEPPTKYTRPSRSTPPTPRTTSPSRPSFSRSSSLCPSSPATPSSSPSPFNVSLLASPNFQPSPPSTPVDLDSLWAEGRVHVPDGFGTWPEGMYARDMAAAFRLIVAGGEDLLSERFKTIFRLPEFPKHTWHKQFRTWKRSSQEERDRATKLPRTFDGLWSEWRKSSTGWASVSGKRLKAS
ncbi:hypothetical protein K438DRAFT_1822709 [Mycena galopus ATCC 62051]|nr:hypothetical protein K438DRAFT_1891543 [Mycena galopus ATCC 62051]KAF8126224.1 hypothetical protein K438DRAFT_1890796 [Mycena galopus ATCC 62051]KAF8126885.1 hypothetical protein K438DRAFT_1890071 [Mycena galopus ATCC 62051]KAF8199881.1 hypothetical protein K438DRAFT_1822709 [Mycena galopus ATCC 62051]